MEGQLCGSVNSWQREKKASLESNSLKFPDIVWKIEDSVLFDTRQVYTCSPFLCSLFESSMTRDRCQYEGKPMYSLDEKKFIFDMIRVFCHTGIVVFTKGESVLRTIERYAAFQFYGIETGSSCLMKLIIEKLTPGNAIQSFEYAVHREDSRLLKEISEYICSYAFLVFRNRSFYSIRRESMLHLANLCARDDLNIPEIDLMGSLYKLCEKKIGDREYLDIKSPMELFKLDFIDNGCSNSCNNSCNNSNSNAGNNSNRIGLWQTVSLWQSVRVHCITMTDFMEFIRCHPGCMSNDDVVDVMKRIHNSACHISVHENDPVNNCSTSLGTLGKRKKFQSISCYPRNLTFNSLDSPQGDIAQLEVDRISAFFAFNCSFRDRVVMPTINFGEKNIRCNVTNSDKSITCRGCVIPKSPCTRAPEDEDLRITVSIVNFKHDRWKKSSANVKLRSSGDFEIPNILSWNAIEGSTSSGYMFDIEKYPEYSEGTWLLMYISVQIVN